MAARMPSQPTDSCYPTPGCHQARSLGSRPVGAERQQCFDLRREEHVAVHHCEVERLDTEAIAYRNHRPLAFVGNEPMLAFYRDTFASQAARDQPIYDMKNVATTRRSAG
jgi:hypothetical protein